MDLIKDVREVCRIGYGFMASKALFAALDLDLFTRIGRQPATLEELSAATDVTSNRLQMLLSALRALGLIGIDVNGRHVNSPAAANFLSTLSPNYYGDLRRLFPVPDRPADLPSMGTPVARNARRTLHAVLRADDRPAGGAPLQRRTACRLARACPPAGSRRSWTFRRSAKLPAGTSTRLGWGSRISLVPGDARSTPWPVEQDAVLMSYLLTAVSESDIAPLLARAFESLSPGGKLILHDFMVIDDRSGPTSAALWLLSDAIGDPQAPQLTPGMLMAAAKSAGFGEPRNSSCCPASPER